MAHPVSTGFHDHSTTLRQLKGLVLLLVLSNIGLGLIAFFALRKTDRRYTDLVNQTVPVLSDLQELTVGAMQVMRLTNPAISTPAPADGASLKGAAEALNNERLQRTRLLASQWIVPASTERATLLASGDEFTRAAGEVVAALQTGRWADATRLRDEALRPAFDRYVLAAMKTTELLETESRRLNDDVSAGTSTSSTLLLSVASWPVVVLVGLLLLTAVFVLVLMALFRGREMSDMP